MKSRCLSLHCSSLWRNMLHVLKMFKHRNREEPMAGHGKRGVTRHTHRIHSETFETANFTLLLNCFWSGQLQVPEWEEAGSSWLMGGYFLSWGSWELDKPMGESIPVQTYWQTQNRTLQKLCHQCCYMTGSFVVLKCLLFTYLCFRSFRRHR